MNYNPLDWYWQADDGRVYSSARQALVASDDAGWLLRLEAGSWTPWPCDENGAQTDAALQWVLSSAGLSIDLETLKESRKNEIDRSAEQERLRYITPGAGQAMTYSRKVTEATALQSDSSPTVEKYPMLAASLGVDGDTLEAVATTILGLDLAWGVIGAKIETVRLKSKQEVTVAATQEEILAVSPVWPTVGDE